MSEIANRIAREATYRPAQQYHLAVLIDEAISEAVAAEREACAALAEAWGQRAPALTDEAFVPGADHGERFASSGIAYAIRNKR